MKKFSGLALKTLLGVAASAVIVGHASAADLAAPEPIVEAVVPSMWDVAFGVAGVTDYRFRGVSQSNQNPAVQGYFEVQAFDWIYAGVWGSSVDFPERRSLTDPAMEVDFYAGIRHTWDAFTIDAGGIYYYYPGEHKAFPGQKQIDYWEIYAKPSYSFGDFGSITGNIFWTSDFVNLGNDALYLSAIPKVNIPLASFPDLAFYVSGEIGKQWFKKSSLADPVDYLTWNVGAGVTYKAMTLDVRYSDTDLKKSECYTNTAARSWCGDAIVAKLSFDTAFSKLK
ncbi:TorF family putative porin [Hansschlegelia sp. KR7-227]|jgi:uncharacterized protein (TIGR02001 family)|uniref:TorF family putative porin n=1 Tax=Hansschlegelia sp. KR7-227 TaxID=3400914 RepID=UPI003C06C8ED